MHKEKEKKAKERGDKQKQKGGKDKVDLYVLLVNNKYI